MLVSVQGGVGAFVASSSLYLNSLELAAIRST